MKKSLNSALSLLMLCAFAAAGTLAFADEIGGGAHSIDHGTMAGIHHGLQGDPVLPPDHRPGQITPIEEKPGHAKGTGDFTGGRLKTITHEKAGVPTHHVTPSN